MTSNAAIPRQPTGDRISNVLKWPLLATAVATFGRLAAAALLMAYDFIAKLAPLYPSRRGRLAEAGPR